MQSDKWTEVVSDVLKTLCERGRITLRKNTPRWRSVLPGFRILAQELGAGGGCADSAVTATATAAAASVRDASAARSSSNNNNNNNNNNKNGDFAEPSVASHAAKLLTVASLACAAATENRVGSWSMTLQGRWNPSVFSHVVHAVAAASTDAPAAVAAAAAASASATGTECGAEAEAHEPASKRQRHAPPPRTAALTTTARPLLQPPDVAEAGEFPASVVSLLQIALLLRQTNLTCHAVRVDDDGSILVTVETVDAASMDTKAGSFVVSSVRHQLCFPGVLSKESFAELARVMYDPETQQDSPLLDRWRRVVYSYGLSTSMFVPFRSFVALGCFDDAQMPFPSMCHPKLVVFSPQARMRSEYYQAFGLALSGSASRAMRVLLAQGYVAALDPVALCQFADAAMSSGSARAAVTVLDAMQSQLIDLLAAVVIRPLLVDGKIAQIVALFPKLFALSHGAVCLVRGYRKLGEHCASDLQRAVDWLDKLQSVSLDQVNVALASVSAETLRALLAALGAPASVHRQEATPGALPGARQRAATQSLFNHFKLFYASLTAEKFAVMRVQRVPAIQLYDLAQDVWLSDTHINWQHWSGCDADPPLQLPPDHMILLCLGYSYGRAIAEAPDAALEHVEDALKRMRFVYRCRCDVMGADAPSTLKARTIINRLLDRRAELVNV